MKGADQDRGSMAVYAAILAPALLICIMLFANASVRWTTWQDANSAAEAAARAAAQPTVDDFTGDQLTLGGTAAGRANGVLSASGYSGSVSIEGDRVVVTVVATVDYVFPFAPFGSSVTGTGEADMKVTGDQ